MSETAVTNDGPALLSNISNELVRLKKRDFGKGPVAAKSYMFDDMLIVVMRQPLTTAERTMVEKGREDAVRSFRQEFQNEATDELTSCIERLTGRQVLTYQSQVMFDPDVLVEMFVFDSAGDGGPQAATAEGQLTEGEQGEATDASVLDDPSHSDR